MIHQVHIYPLTEPVTLDDMRAHLGISQATDISRDAIIESRIISARIMAENHIRGPIMKQTFIGYAVDFPYAPENFHRLNLKAPLMSVTSISYLDTDGVRQVLDTDLYQVDLVSSCVVPAYGTNWPDVRTELNSLQVEYISGYGAIPAIPTTTVTAGTFTTATSTDATDKYFLMVDGIVIIDDALDVTGIDATILQAAVDEFSDEQVHFYTVTGTVAGSNLTISKLDGSNIIIESGFTDATGLGLPAGTANGGVFSGFGFVGTTLSSGANTVPEAIKEAIRFIVGQWEVFQSSIEGVMRPFTIPNAAKQLLDPYSDMREYF